MLPDYVLPHHTPPPAPAPTLTVTAPGQAYLSKALLTRLSLRAGQPADLLPPSPDCSSWQLDTRPTAARRISWYADTRPRIRGLKLPAGLLLPGAPLTLALAATAPTSPGLYVLAQVTVLP
jgi:hypothetical protein